MEHKTCKICGALLGEGENKCKICGNLIDDEIVIIKKKQRRFRKNTVALKDKKISFLIRNALLVLLSAIMLVFAFLPIFKLDIDLEETIGIEDDFSFKITPINAIIFYIDSLYNLDDDELYDSNIGEKAEEYQAKLTEEIKEIVEKTDKEDLDDIKLTASQKKLLQKSVYYSARMSLRSENEPSRGYMLASMIFSILYIAFATALFALSIINLILVLLKRRSLFGVALYFLYALIPIIIADYFCISPMGAITLGVAEKGMTLSAVLTIILPIAFAIYLLIERSVLTKNIQIGKIVKNSISLAISIVAICLIFTPLIGTKIKTDFRVKNSDGISATHKKGEAKTKVPVFYFAELGLTDDEIEALPETMPEYQQIFEEFSRYTRHEVSSGYADAVNAEFLKAVSKVEYGAESIPIFGFIYYLTLAVGLFAGITAMQNLICISTGKKCRALIIISKLLCFVCALATMVFIIIYISFINSGADVLKLDYTASIAAGPIVLIVFALGLVFVPSRDKKIIYKYEEETATASEEIKVIAEEQNT